MKKFSLIIGDHNYKIEDLGESINSQFIELYNNHFCGCCFDKMKFKNEAVNFFNNNDGNYESHNRFFNNFSIIWQSFLNQKFFKNPGYPWDYALDIAHEWENKNNEKSIHKGTAYYFWGVSCILNEDLEKGFLLMHQALEEDKKRGLTNTPAYSFVTLDYENQNQFFKPKVIEIKEFLKEKINNYYLSRRGTLTLIGFKSKFFEVPGLEEIIFYFIFALFRLKKLHQESDQKLTENVFGSLFQVNTIFAFCLIIDNVLKQKIPNQDNKFINLLDSFSSKCSLKIKKNDLIKINKKFTECFSDTLQSLLIPNFQFQNRANIPPNSIEEDLAIAYGFRNFGAHKIESQPIIYKNFVEISQRILNALFFTVEKLYI